MKEKDRRLRWQERSTCKHGKRWCRGKFVELDDLISMFADKMLEDTPTMCLRECFLFFGKVVSGCMIPSLFQRGGRVALALAIFRESESPGALNGISLRGRRVACEVANFWLLSKE